MPERRGKHSFGDPNPSSAEVANIVARLENASTLQTRMLKQAKNQLVPSMKDNILRNGASLCTAAAFVTLQIAETLPQTASQITGSSSELVVALEQAADGGRFLVASIIQGEAMSRGDESTIVSAIEQDHLLRRMRGEYISPEKLASDYEKAMYRAESLGRLFTEDSTRSGFTLVDDIVRQSYDEQSELRTSLIPHYPQEYALFGIKKAARDFKLIYGSGKDKDLERLGRRVSQ